MGKTVLGIFAHPDDAEFGCAGTLSLLIKEGWDVHIATMAKGDKGTAELSSEEISLIRAEEAKNAAEVIGGSYHGLGFNDLYILYDRESINRTVTLLRTVRPSVVITASPDDYMFDHEITSHIVQTACFCAGIKNMDVEVEAYEPVPYLYYCDPMDGKDKLGNPVNPSIYINIGSEMKIKEEMLACHASQRHWLLVHHKIDEYILSMKRFAEKRGKEINAGYAEGFRQHLGHGYPQDNILKRILGDKVTEK